MRKAIHLFLSLVELFIIQVKNDVSIFRVSSIKDIQKIINFFFILRIIPQ